MEFCGYPRTGCLQESRAQVHKTEHAFYVTCNPPSWHVQQQGDADRLFPEIRRGVEAASMVEKFFSMIRGNRKNTVVPQGTPA